MNKLKINCRVWDFGQTATAESSNSKSEEEFGIELCGSREAQSGLRESQMIMML